MTKIKIIFSIILLILMTGNLYSKEFLNNFLHINLGVAYSIPHGDIIKFEKNDYFILTPDNEKARPTHNGTIFGVAIDIAPIPPLILGLESHALKFGIRAVYRFHYLQQQLTYTSSQDNEKNYIGDLMAYQSWMFGPVVHYSPSVEISGINGEYISGGGFTFYALYGQLVNGLLTRSPVQRESSSSFSGDYETKIDGYKIDVGIGSEIAICSINLGLNLYYSWINYNMNEKVYSTLSKSSGYQEFVIEVYMGIPVGELLFPRL